MKDSLDFASIEVEIRLGVETARLDGQYVVEQGGAHWVIDRCHAPLSSGVVQPDLPLILVVPSDSDVPWRVDVLASRPFSVNGLGPGGDDQGVGVRVVGLEQEGLPYTLLLQLELVLNVVASTEKLLLIRSGGGSEQTLEVSQELVETILHSPLLFGAAGRRDRRTVGGVLKNIVRLAEDLMRDHSGSMHLLI